MADRTHAVVLSDIHIGNGAPTCWYQPAVHDEYLTAALRWVAHDERIRDVIFLGDLFDVWTYPPSTQPPAMVDILAANGKLLGPTGPFAELVKALPGHVAFMPGNHDGTIGALEIAQLNTALGGNVARGEAVKLVPDAAQVLRRAQDGPGTVVSHGHHWCMFNAPDPKSPWGGQLPVGHLVSRAIAYQWSKKLRPGQTVADLPGMGNPGLDLSKVNVLGLIDLWVGRSDDIVSPMIDYICKTTGMPPTEPIVLPGGRTTTANDAKRDFAYLFADWLAKLGRRADARRAAAADLKGKYLAWFAQRLALQTRSDLVVMGHTHEPVAGLRVSPISYVNSGYECVSKPDLRTNNFTFTLIDLDRAAAKIYKVVKRGSGFVITPADVPFMDSAIQGLAFDYSCYVRVTNRTGVTLRLAGTPNGGSAFWAVPPPATIANGERADIWLQDELMKEGAEGDFTYTDAASAHGSTFQFACPLPPRRNRVVSPVHNFETKSGKSPWRAGKTDWVGHPLQVRFIAEPAILVPPTPNAPQPAVLAANADYLAITRPLLARYDEDRGKVMCHARMISSDRQPLIDTTTEPGLLPGQIRLKNPPNHLMSPDVYAVDDPTYGLFHYVLISPNGPMAPPVLGGFLFLPRPGLPSLHLVTFNVARLDVSDRRQCGNAHHAEQQVTRWISEQSSRWRNRIECLTLTNNSRKADFAYSPCNACCHDLASFLGGMNSLRGAGKLAAALSWGNVYNKAAICGHPTDKTGIKLLKDSGWKLQGPVPRGVDSADGMTARPGETPCLAPEPVAPARVLTTA